MRIHVTQLPAAQAAFEAGYAAYAAAREAHKQTVGEPAPFPEHEIYRVIYEQGGALEIFDDPPPVEPVFTLEQRRAAALRQIDGTAEAVRMRYITPGAGQAATYLLKERQAEAFKAASYAGAVPAMIQAEADATGQSAQAAADAILAERDAWVFKAAQIERERRGGKLTAAAAADAAELELALANALAALDAL